MPSQIIHLKCPTCGKVAKEKTRLRLDNVGKVFVILECNHAIMEDSSVKIVTSDLVSSDGRSPYAFQVENAEFVEKSNYRALIADEPGLGKTISALLTIHRDKENTLPALFLVKSGLRAQFFNEITRWLGPRYAPQVIETSREKAYPGFMTYVCSLDLLSRLNGTFDDVNIKLVVVDECQLIKNSEAKRTQEVRKLVKGISKVLFLSGTPIKNKPEEYFTVLNICRPTMFPTLAGYIQHWLYTDYRGGYVKTMGLRSPERFHTYTSDFIIRHRKSDVLPDLPRVDRRLFYTNLNDSEQNNYNTVVDQFVDYVDDHDEKGGLDYYQNILVYFSRMRHITGQAKVRSAFDKAVEFLEETDRKLTIFCHHKDVLAQLQFDLMEWCEENDQPAPVSLTSDMNMDQRAEAVEKFRTTARILLASTLASGEGLNLQFCSDAIMLERQWNPANEEQAECRFERIGQTNNIFVQYFIALGTIDEYFTELVERKRAMINAAMNGTAVAWNEQEMMKDLVNTIVTKRNNEKWQKPSL